MLPYFRERFGNASSKHHRAGWIAREAVEVAREQLAALISATPRELIFTSGATESNNLAIRGVARAHVSRGRHLITQATEHRAVLDVFASLEREGFEVSVLGVDGAGRVDLEELKATFRPDTTLLSIMSANNEVGTLHPVDEIANLCAERGVVFHCDATQSVGNEPFSVTEQHLVSMSAHKFYGPKGVGALFVRRKRPRVSLEAMVVGGGQERGLRAGTLNVPGIVGMGAAANLCVPEEQRDRLRRLRDNFEDRFLATCAGVRVNGPARPERLANTTNLSFPGCVADDLLLAAKEVAASTGSACTSASLELSHVLSALGYNRARVLSSVRLGLGRSSTEEQLDRALASLNSAFVRTRQADPPGQTR